MAASPVRRGPWRQGIAALRAPALRERLRELGTLEARATLAAMLAPAARVSVVIPAWNEAETMPELLDGIRKVLEPRAREVEILVVVPAPDDPTAAPARAGGARVLAQRRPGYGGALKEGLLAARGDYVVTLDADLSHPPARIADLFERRDEAEVVIASRYVAGGSAAMPAGRAVASRLLNWVYRRALSIPVRDLSSGFRLYQRRVLGELDLRSEKYDILEEILVKIYCLGWRVLEIPFDYQVRAAGESHASVLRFTPHFLRTLFQLWKMRNTFTSADYDARAYDSIVLPQRWWQRRRFRLVTELAGGAAARLDVGCGSSQIIRSCPSSVGVDVEMAKLRFLRPTHPHLARASVSHLPFPDACFSTVVCSQVIEHVPYERRIFLELNRVLREGGTLVIGTPDYGRIEWRTIEWLYKLLLPNSYGDDHVTHYDRHRLTEELAGAGFAIRESRSILGAELVLRCVKREDVPGSAAPGPAAA